MATPPLRCQADAPLDDANSLRLKANARCLIELQELEQWPAALDMLRTADRQPALLLGGGTNVVFASPRIERPVLRVRLSGIRMLGDRRRSPGERDTAIVEVAAGEPWDPFVRHMLSQGWQGLENLALIPGTVGAAPVQNIGAYGVEQDQVFEGLRALNLETGEDRWFSRAECDFGYRSSFFKSPAGAAWLIVAVRYRLARIAAARSTRIDYPDLRAELASRGIAWPGALDVADAVSAIRRRKLPDPAHLGNVGSFFKNPIVPAEVARALSDREPALPLWSTSSPARIKLSAAWMIDRCGWKGVRLGEAGVHPQHALVLVNHGQASGRDVLSLADQIRDSVQARFGVSLAIEPTVID